MRATLRAFPTMLRVGLAQAVAYRAEMLVWMFTNTMPLVNLALWHAVARNGPIAGFTRPALVAYFLAAMIVRQLTGSWVLWEMTRDIRTGILSMRLLRPVHPLFAYAAENLSALPLRAGFVIPIGIIAFAVSGTSRLPSDPLLWAIFALALVGAWLMSFFVMAAMGALAFFLESALSIFEVWLGAFFTLSGYFFPLDFLAHRAPWAVSAARVLPFYVMNGFPIELMLGMRTREEALRLLALEWCYVLVFGLAAVGLFRAGLRRYNAYGA